jgi:hypothetical protein
VTHDREARCFFCLTDDEWTAFGPLARGRIRFEGQLSDCPNPEPRWKVAT